MNVLVSVAIVIMVTSLSIGVVMLIGSQSVERSRSFSQVSDAEQFFGQLDNAIKEVAAEGQGSTRAIKVASAKDFVINPGDESIQYKSAAGSFFDYMSRRKSGNFIYISGNDVSCHESDYDGDGDIDIIAENNIIMAVFQKINKTSPFSNFSTSGNIIALLEKSTNQKIAVSNSSIIIDGNTSSSGGNGYSELLNSGSGLPQCEARFFMNSTGVMYDVYYTLYSGADFILTDVRNVVDK